MAPESPPPPPSEAQAPKPVTLGGLFLSLLVAWLIGLGLYFLINFSASLLGFEPPLSYSSFVPGFLVGSLFYGGWRLHRQPRRP